MLLAEVFWLIKFITFPEKPSRFFPQNRDRQIQPVGNQYQIEAAVL